MKISQIFLPFQQMLKAVTQLLNTELKQDTVLVPVRVREGNRFSNMLSREAERRSNQGNINNI